MGIGARERAARSRGDSEGGVGGGGEGDDEAVVGCLGAHAVTPMGKAPHGGAALVGEEGGVALMAVAGGTDGEGGGGGTCLAGSEGGCGDEGTLSRAQVSKEGGEDAGGGGDDGVLVVGGEVKGAIEGSGEVGVGEAKVVEGVGDATDKPEEGDVEGRWGGRKLVAGEVEGEEVPVAEATVSEGASRMLMGGEATEDEGAGAVVGGGEDERHVKPGEAVGSGPGGGKQVKRRRPQEGRAGAARS